MNGQDRQAAIIRHVYNFHWTALDCRAPFSFDAWPERRTF